MTEVIFVNEGQLVRSIEVPGGQRTDMVFLVMPGEAVMSGWMSVLQEKGLKPISMAPMSAEVRKR